MLRVARREWARVRVRTAADTAEAPLCSPMLTMLELEVNEQIALPPLSSSNTLLTSVLASFNRLGGAPMCLATHGRSLKKLHLGCNGLSDVAPLLPSLTRLVELTLEGNRLSELPAAVGSLAKLKELWVHGNRLRQLPGSLGSCSSLTVLQCHHNLLAELPDALAQLSKLQGLYLQSNRLSDLAGLRRRILDKMPLQNLGLGNNRFDLADAFERDGTRVGLGWNGGGPVPRPLARKLSMWFASTDHALDLHCDGVRAPLLLVAFAAQGPGMQQWLAPVLTCRASGLALDALFVADPSNSYYLQDPGGAWDGVRYYERLVARHAAGYQHVLLIGSSMGASAALLHAHLGSRAIAFAPRVDLSASHGAYVPDGARAAGLAHTRRSLRALRGHADVHVGRCNYVDVAQVAPIAHEASVRVHTHNTYHHNVPAYLEREGRLGPMVKAACVELLRSPPPPPAS